jgi:outer membrane receptor protein involved in Fe transport
MAAPGDDQFLPPQHAGVWLPPQRTFSALGGGRLRPEQVDHYELGFDAAMAPSVLLTFRTFRESADDQIATLFGLDEANEAGHYYFATAGSVDVRGVAIGIDARVTDALRGRIVYTRSDADWHDPRGRRRLSRVAPSLIRLGAEQGHDLFGSIDGVVPRTATHVSLAYRVSSLFSEAGPGAPEPVRDGRFRIDIRQQLPFRPIGEGELNVLMSARTLLRDTMQDGSFYDELMTVAPPVQVVGGIQLRF